MLRQICSRLCVIFTLLLSGNQIFAGNDFRSWVCVDEPWVTEKSSPEGTFLKVKNGERTPYSFEFEMLGCFGQSSSPDDVMSSGESRYAYWDPSLRACVPWLGRELPTSGAPWAWQILPQGVLFRSYFASGRESRIGVQFFHENRQNFLADWKDPQDPLDWRQPNNFWDNTLGGRVGLIRYGNFEKLYPEGFQVDIEGAVLSRMTLDDNREVWTNDYRFGFPLTFRYGHFEYKFGYYHISSHRGDKMMVRQEDPRERLNFVRDCLMLGVAYRPDANWRFYFEMNYAFWTSGGARPWQFELGFEYSPMMMPNWCGSPFWAVHCRFSQDNKFGSTVSMQLGWQWKDLYQRTFRTGLYLMDGYTDQYQIYDRKERQIGYGFWYDF